jgi:hypothetical protein
MYETVLSPQNYEDYMQDEEQEFEYVTVDYEDWKKELTLIATNYIKNDFLPTLKKYGVENIEGTGIWSPKEYNFTGDALEMEITMQENWQEIFAQRLEELKKITACQEYIKEHYHSHSGFISFMPKSFDAIECWQADEDRCIAAYLTLALLAEGELRGDAETMDDIYWAGMYEFGDYDRINVLAEYMDDKEEADKLLALYENDLEWNDLYWQLADKVGFLWLHDGIKYLEGKKDRGYFFNANTDAKKMLFWAVKNNYTVTDLYQMAA